jgi:hypothetical protein
MTPSAIAASYSDAVKIINDAKLEVVYVDILWQKVRRVKTYLDAQAAEELLPILSDEDHASLGVE